MSILKRILFCIGVILYSVSAHADGNLIEQTQTDLPHIPYDNIPQLVEEYQRLHPDINLQFKNFDEYREKIHPDMPKVRTIHERYRTKHGNRKGFISWLFSKHSLSLEEIQQKIHEYQKLHPDIDLQFKNFNEHRKKIHPNMPKVNTIRSRYRTKHGKEKGFTGWLFSKHTLSLEEIHQKVHEYQRLHSDINLQFKNFDEHREKIHPDMPKMETIRSRYITKYGNGKDFTGWLFSKHTLSLKEIHQQVHKYQRLHPDINLQFKNFDEHREKIHPNMPKVRTIQSRYRTKHGNVKGFTGWLFSKNSLSLEEIHQKVHEYQRLHSDINLQFKNFDEHREKIHPDMPKVNTIQSRYRTKHGNVKGFRGWFSINHTLSLEEIHQKVHEYQRLHPDINLQFKSFDEHREKIHPNMPKVKTIHERYRTKHGNVKGFRGWLFSRECANTIQNIFE